MVYRTWALPLVLCGLVLAGLRSQADAAIIDLTTEDASNLATNGTTAALGGNFLVVQIPDQSTGTGVIDPFVRIQSAGYEQGYNTDNGTPLNTKGGTFTHALLISDIPLVTIDNIEYRQFLLDINQNSGQDNELLSLNQIQIFTGASDPTSFDSLSGPDTSNNTPYDSVSDYPEIGFDSLTQIFRMSNADGVAPYDTQILLNYALNAGSGSGDMFLYIRNSNFGPGEMYVVLYSQFGNPPGESGSNDGFEEWATVGEGGGVNPEEPAPPVVPEPASMAIWGLGAGLALVVARFRRKTAV